MNRQLLIVLFFVACIVSFSCKQRGAENNGNANDSLLIGALSDTAKITDGSIPIFYNMYLSVEMSSLFKAIGSTYNVQLINSPDRVDAYETSTDKAMNLGVYAVDLMYAKYFEQFEQAGKYLKNMNRLSTELGIPNDKFLASVKRIETNLSNKDSLISIANELYKNTEENLKANDRESSAALIVAGGWIETMNIAVQLANAQSTDIELIERIIAQKTSIDNLISLLSKFSNEPVIKDMLVKLADIRVSLKKLVLDSRDMSETYKQLDELKLKLSGLRREVVS